MRLGGHRPGSLTIFVDASTEEALLEVSADEDGTPLVGFRLYDRLGNLASQSNGRLPFPDGLQVLGESEEVLLLLPQKPEENIQYRLYSSQGRLLASSDGERTRIFGNLRLDGAKPNAKRAS
jgi:hypothetical protein